MQHCKPVHTPGGGGGGVSHLNCNHSLYQVIFGTVEAVILVVTDAQILWHSRDVINDRSSQLKSPRLCFVLKSFVACRDGPPCSLYVCVCRHECCYLFWKAICCTGFSITPYTSWLFCVGPKMTIMKSLLQEGVPKPGVPVCGICQLWKDGPLLTQPTSAQMWSPWQHTTRPPSWILCGFSVIDFSLFFPGWVYTHKVDYSHEVIMAKWERWCPLIGVKSTGQYINNDW